MWLLYVSLTRVSYMCLFNVSLICVSYMCHVLVSLTFVYSYCVLPFPSIGHAVGETQLETAVYLGVVHTKVDGVNLSK